MPGIDDGSPDVDTSIHLISKLHELGFHKFICTPHIFKEFYPNTQETIGAALKIVREKVKLANLKIEIGAGAEYMIDSDFKMTDKLVCLSGKYLLIEMSYLMETPNIEQVIFDLQIKGYTVVLAHPERYNFYHKNVVRYQRLKDMGCLFQLNLLSVTGYYGKEVKSASEYLLKVKLYDLAGTDLHHEKHLRALEKEILNTHLFQAVGNYPFKNKELFG